MPFSNCKNSKFVFFSILLVQFFAILLFTYLSPYISDDYSNFLANKGMAYIGDNFIYQYFNWGGSLVGNISLSLFLLLPKIFFNFYNAFIYTATIVLIYLHVNGVKKTNNILLLIIISLLWFIPPAWGQDYLWITGNAMYGTPTFFILLALLPLSLELKEPLSKFYTVLLSIFLFSFSCFAAWSTANSAVGVCVFCICILIERKINSKKLRIYEMFAMAGFFIGAILMIVAPGNYARMDAFSDSRPFVIKLVLRFFDISIRIIETFHILIPSFITMLSYIIMRKEYKKLIKPAVYFISFLAVFYSMVMSPTFPDRAMLLGVAFFIIAILSLLLGIEVSKEFLQIEKITVLSFSLTILPLSVYKASRNIYHLKNGWKQRIELINQEKEKGNLNLKVPIIKIINKHVSGYDLIDLSKKSDDFPNDAIAEFFEIESIQGYED